MKKHGATFEFWVPKYIDIDIERKLSSIGNVLKFLTSPQYGATNFKRFPVAFFVTKIVRLYKNKKNYNAFFRKQVKRIVTTYCLLPAFIKIARQSKNSGLHIVFPTLDYMGIQLIWMIEKYLSDITIHVRRMGSESRSPFSTGEEFTNFIMLVETSSKNTIQMGIPTLGLLDELRQKSTQPNRIHWSPLPPNLKNESRHRNRAKVLNIGFPGTAKLSKGYSKIPMILDNLAVEGIYANVFLQKALHPWNGYAETRSQIFSSKHSIHELDSVLGIDEYQLLLSQLDLIFLPYERESYLNADSGILYEAADQKIPIFCGDDLGFSEEAFLNGIGFNLSGSESINALIIKALSEQTQFNIDEYNKKRSEALQEFLFGKSSV